MKKWSYDYERSGLKLEKKTIYLKSLWVIIHIQRVYGWLLCLFLQYEQHIQK